MRELFNQDWKFYKTLPGTDYKTAVADKEQFASVVIPHDFAIEKFESFYEDAIGWYLKDVELNKPEDGKILLYFDGIYMDSAIYVNGVKACEWKYGYTPFEVDITPYIIDGKNEICVSVTFMNPNSRWYSGAGITRNVFIDEVPSTYIPRYGIYANAVNKGGEEWLLTVDTEVILEDSDFYRDTVKENIVNTIKYKLSDGTKDNPLSAKETLVLREEKGCKDTDNTLTVRSLFDISSPELWDIINPKVYTLTVSIDNGFSESTDIGFRTIELTSDKGAFLNGRHIKLKVSVSIMILVCSAELSMRMQWKES